MSESLILLLAGTVCIVISALMVYTLPPREGRPPSAWTRTEARAMSSAMLTLILFFTGAIMIAKGAF